MNYVRNGTYLKYGDLNNCSDGYYYKTYGKAMVPSEENSTRVPTWPEFVDYLINTLVGRSVGICWNLERKVLDFFF